jgi:hypothetical protein
MKRLLLVILAFPALFMLNTSCEKKDYPAGVDSLAHHYYAIFVPNNNTGVTATRSQVAPLKLPVQFYSTFVRNYDAVAKYMVVTAGITPPAATGVDFDVVDKNGAILQPAADGTYSMIFPQAKQTMDTIYLKMRNNPAPGARKFEIQMVDNRTSLFDVDIFSTAFRRPVTIN